MNMMHMYLYKNGYKYIHHENKNNTTSLQKRFGS